MKNIVIPVGKISSVLLCGNYLEEPRLARSRASTTVFYKRAYAIK